MNRINKDNYNRFTYTNEELLKGAPVGIVHEFHGLNGGRELVREHYPLAHYFAERNIIYTLPCYGPWSWMNRASIIMIDQITEALFDKYQKQMPIASTGYSMGGLAGLIYTRYAKYTPVVCATISPVCDLHYHYTEREDTARSIFTAYAGYDMPFDDAVTTGSPLHQAGNMPRIAYGIFSGTADDQVNYIAHSETFVKKMRELGHTVEYHAVPDKGHCELTGVMIERYKEFIADNIQHVDKHIDTLSGLEKI